MRINPAGYELIGDIIEPRVASLIVDAFGRVGDTEAAGTRGADKKSSVVARYANSSEMLTLASNYLDGEPRLVRSIFFNKSPYSNWLVPWHQDKTVALSTRFDDPAWGPWSLKDGIDHVQPPTEVLEDTVIVRVHLDACSRANGCLKVMPGSHKHGILTQSELSVLAAENKKEYLEAPALSGLVMSPLLVHASSKVQSKDRRRVLHLEFCSYNLPPGVKWG